MAKSSNKSTTQSAASTVQAKWPFAKKAIEPTPASETTTKKTSATPKKTAAVASNKIIAAATKETAPIQSKKVSAPKTEATASKPAATAKSTTAKSVKKNTVTPEERYKMIATAAFFRAEKRGFATGYETEDWSASESEIDEMLNA